MADCQWSPREPILERSYAFSYWFNPRNIEYYWYPLWAQTLFQLAENIPTTSMIMAPQFPMIRDHGGVSDEIVEEGKTVLDPDELEETKHDGIQDTSEPLDPAGDSDLDTSVETIPVKNAKGVVVDFVIINLGTEEAKQKTNRNGGMDVIVEDVILLVEVKRFASRSLNGLELNKQIREQLMEAKADLCRQAAHLFLLDEVKESVLAICAAGPYWSETKIFRKDIEATLARLSKIKKSDDVNLKDRQLKWGRPMRIGSDSSNKNLLKIRHELIDACKQLTQYLDSLKR
ncbi:hypothetical protein P692DRAFT_20956929 [Suillus brevipes Sb2]|nr:hypothetical protein P692DRAFT_20956929 [Suillus brevipes Sb2]